LDLLKESPLRYTNPSLLKDTDLPGPLRKIKQLFEVGVYKGLLLNKLSVNQIRIDEESRGLNLFLYCSS
ncbi:hypothetical protein, partial [Bradyrhizobium sp. TM233]|uniref:hypothetical protein n=1 Tax=Bradyrhizobium sp. TM233 TaxID=2599801 RepID=UPI0030C717C0